MFSKAYTQHLERGPFPGQVDPWVEAERYTRQLHPGLISSFFAQLQHELLAFGYIAGSEASLQVAEPPKSNQRTHGQTTNTAPNPSLDYAQAAQAASAEPGLILNPPEPALNAIFIRDLQSRDLITVIEILSAHTKQVHDLAFYYTNRRARLRREGIHVVEIDLTRSRIRLVNDILLKRYAYHIAIHLHNQPARFIGIHCGESLKRWALPLRTEVIGVDMQAAYDYACRQTVLAGHILRETSYSQETLPFPSLFSPDRRDALSKTVRDWQTELKRLQSAS